jgi:hypothetical protein
MTDFDISKSTEAYFCPQCGSSSLDLPELAGGIASCKACGWVGQSQQLLIHQFEQEHGTDAELINRLMGELRTTLARECAVPLGRLLYRWGFVGSKKGNQAVVDPAQMGRYMTAMAKAIMESIIKTREEIEKGEGETEDSGKGRVR